MGESYGISWLDNDRTDQWSGLSCLPQNSITRNCVLEDEVTEDIVIPSVTSAKSGSDVTWLYYMTRCVEMAIDACVDKSNGI